MYRYSMTQWIVGNEDMETSVQRLQKCGYDGIEFAGEPQALDMNRLNNLMEIYGLECTSICGIFSADRDLSSDNPAVAKNAVQYLENCVDMAVKVGAPYIIVVPSAVGKTKPDESYEIAWNNAVDNIIKVADYAASKNILLAIEAINRYETYLVNNLTLALKLVKEIDHPSVRLMADLFHMSIEENSILDSLHKIAPYLIHVHIADNTREAAGLGHTDFKEVLYVLHSIGYNGPLTMEFLPRVADPYTASDMVAREKLMDIYAKQSIDYMKQMEESITYN